MLDGFALKHDIFMFIEIFWALIIGLKKRYCLQSTTFTWIVIFNTLKRYVSQDL